MDTHTPPIAMHIKHLESLKFGLAIVIALVFTATFTMNYFHEGTSLSKYITKQLELDRVKEVEAVAYTDMMLYADELTPVSEDVDLTEKAGSEEGFQRSQQIRFVDKNVTLVLMIVAWLMLIPALQRKRALSFIYLLMGMYLALLSVCKGLNGGSAFSEWAVPAHATRWLPCIALWLWLYLKPSSAENPYRVVKWMLIVSVSMTFATHGMEAIQLNPAFRDLLIGGFETISVTVFGPVSEVLLRLIGVMDVALALLIIFFQRKLWFLWMAAWGALTALSRPIAFGDILWEDALLRSGNCLIPVIIILWIYRKNTQTTKV